MTAKVTLLPSGKEFLLEGAESILQAGLRNGLALDYGCSNGNCGLCKVRVTSGQVKKITHCDYVLTESEKSRGCILSCSNTAASDVVLEAGEAGGVNDIPEQSIQIRIKKIERPNSEIIILSTKTPRTKRLRFLAGQTATLSIDGVGSQSYSIASCPCDDMNLQFHILSESRDPVAHYLDSRARVNDVISLRGPNGSFCLDENSPNSLVFVAQGSGFAPVRGLIEQAMALESAERIYLFRIDREGGVPYLNNLCRSWHDAFDNFHYLPIACENNSRAVDALVSVLSTKHNSFAGLDFYLCAKADLTARIKLSLAENGVAKNQMRSEILISSATDNRLAPGSADH